MKRIVAILCALCVAFGCFSQKKAKSAADTIKVSSVDVTKRYSEKYINKNGDERERYFIEISGKKLPKNAPTKSNIAKCDYIYLTDAASNNQDVSLLYILKNGRARVVCGGVAPQKKPEQGKKMGLVGSQPMNTDEQKLCVKKIIKVKDGDTFDYMSCGGEIVSVRLSGIDAPEKGGKSVKGQPMSEKSRQYLAELLQKGDIKLIRTGVSHKRIVCEVYAGDVNVCLELVKAGLAWREPHFDTANKYLEAENNARMQKKGIWSEANPMAPWKWRRLPKGEK